MRTKRLFLKQKNNYVIQLLVICSLASTLLSCTKAGAFGVFGNIAGRLSTFGTGTTYYISSSGNDTNNGTSSSTPWKTMKTLLPGATYLLKRGDTLYFTIEKIANNTQKITIDAYGTGYNPQISLYKNIRASAWQLYSGNIWKVDLKDTSKYTGYKDISDTNVGFIYVNGVIKGAKFN
ncbi:MAG: hypothetical protein JWM28_4487, partial [Chitinophagaceae bacterium]|nr:hypothetical protein [Chitinophagaceae bacterium]